MVKYNTLFNWVLEILLFPAVISLRVFLFLLDPLYKVLLHIKPQVKFSLVQYFWNIKSKCFLSSLIAICLFVFHGIFVSLDTTHNLVLDSELRSAPVYLLALPYPFLVASYVVSVIALGESFDANYRHCLELPLLIPILYLCIFAKMLELHHPGFLFSMVIRPKRFVTTISVTTCNMTSSAHTFTFAPYGTVRDLRSQVNSKFKITSDLYWLSCRCKPLRDVLTLGEITGSPNSDHTWTVAWYTMLFKGM